MDSPGSRVDAQYDSAALARRRRRPVSVGARLRGHSARAGEQETALDGELAFSLPVDGLFTAAVASSQGAPASKRR